ncbi:Kinesin-like protein KIN-5C [Camellia lanceoleosa]|uniref:Kinesin-like protein KIN-5C n=1 Tax=Camellia lanceoleosa TaxID=1840588 RepID=A0ACC0HNZ3_9ERIC|nr:Kinesin-like protein KIN-5C [Camellia lanceoleosa]
MSIKEFQKAYEEQSTSDAEKLIADVTNLVSSHIRRQKELVDAWLIHLKDTVVGNKTFLDGHVSSMEGITTDAKRKWQEFSVQAENDAKDCADFSAAKHCRMELLFQQCVNTAETASKHWKRTHESINEIGSQNVSTLVSLVRDVSDSNEQHNTEIALARTTVEEDVAKNSEDFIQHFDRVSEQECASVSDILATESRLMQILLRFSGRITLSNLLLLNKKPWIPSSRNIWIMSQLAQHQSDVSQMFHVRGQLNLFEPCQWRP